MVYVIVLLIALAWCVSLMVGFVDRLKRDAALLRATTEERKRDALPLVQLEDLLLQVPTGYIRGKDLFFAAKRARDCAKRIAPEGQKAAATLRLQQALARQARERISEIEKQDEQKRAEIALGHIRQRIAQLAAEAGPPESDQLVITPTDFDRDNEADRGYRKMFLLRLLTHFGNRCPVCDRDDRGLDLDHFFLPKSAGGNFVLLRRDGVRINNAVPMCESCNRRKGTRHYLGSVSPAVVQRILEMNREMNKLLNPTS